MTEPYRIRSDDTWNDARDAYLAGGSGPEVCARFDIGESAFRRRARKEGWRRVDQADPEPDDFEDDDLPDIDEEALAALAFRKMTVAARKDRLDEALRWGRLRDMALRQLAGRAAVQTRVDRAVRSDRIAELREISDTARTIVHTAQALRTVGSDAPKVHDVHDVHPVSRAERRRRAALSRKTGPP